MVEVNSWNVRPLQLHLLQIAKSFIEVCDRHSLRYYTSGGTTLGALRHKGFIPWDDDMDFEMPHEDFVQFLQYARMELPPHLRVCRGGNVGPIWGSKIVDMRTDVLEDLKKKTNLNLTELPFIDVFMIEGVPETLDGFRSWYRERRIWRLVQMYRHPESMRFSGGQHTMKAVIGRIVGFFLSWQFPRTKSNDEMMSLLDDIVAKWSFDKSHSVVEPCFFNGKTLRITPRHFYGEGRLMEFEGGTIRCPMKAEERCIINYGDYMKLPPEEHRIPEHAFKCDYNHV